MTDNIEALIDVIERALESSHEVSILDELNTLHEDSSPITHDYCEFLGSDDDEVVDQGYVFGLPAMAKSEDWLVPKLIRDDELPF